MVVYLATITGIDKAYYEAAGGNATVYDLAADPLHHPASDEDRYHHDVYHGSSDVFSTPTSVCSIRCPEIPNTLYNYVYTLDVYVYKQLKTSTTGMASAAAFVQSVAGCITILTANAIVRKIDRESAMI